MSIESKLARSASRIATIKHAWTFVERLEEESAYLPIVLELLASGERHISIPRKAARIRDERIADAIKGIVDSL